MISKTVVARSAKRAEAISLLLYLFFFVAFPLEARERPGTHASPNEAKISRPQSSNHFDAVLNKLKTASGVKVGNLELLKEEREKLAVVIDYIKGYAEALHHSCLSDPVTKKQHPATAAYVAFVEHFSERLAKAATEEKGTVAFKTEKLELSALLAGIQDFIYKRNIQDEPSKTLQRAAAVLGTILGTPPIGEPLADSVEGKLLHRALTESELFLCHYTHPPKSDLTPPRLNAEKMSLYTKDKEGKQVPIAIKDGKATVKDGQKVYLALEATDNKSGVANKGLITLGSGETSMPFLATATTYNPKTTQLEFMIDIPKHASGEHPVAQIYDIADKEGNQINSLNFAQNISPLTLKVESDEPDTSRPEVPKNSTLFFKKDKSGKRIPLPMKDGKPVADEGDTIIATMLVFDKPSGVDAERSGGTFTPPDMTSSYVYLNPTWNKEDERLEFEYRVPKHLPNGLLFMVNTITDKVGNLSTTTLPEPIHILVNAKDPDNKAPEIDDEVTTLPSPKPLVKNKDSVTFKIKVKDDHSAIVQTGRLLFTDPQGQPFELYPEWNKEKGELTATAKITDTFLRGEYKLVSIDNVVDAMGNAAKPNDLDGANAGFIVTNSFGEDPRIKGQIDVDKLPEKEKQLILGLGADQFRVRENTQTQLSRMGSEARPILLKALRSGDAEVRRRAENLLNRLASLEFP